MKTEAFQNLLLKSAVSVIACDGSIEESEISEIRNRKLISDRESQQKIEIIENQIQLEKLKSKADAEFYQAQQQAEANKLKFTPEFMQIKFYDSISNNLKMYFGPSIPDFLNENAVKFAQ